jgi:hypothetical protein
MGPLFSWARALVYNYLGFIFPLFSIALVSKFYSNIGFLFSEVLRLVAKDFSSLQFLADDSHILKRRVIEMSCGYDLLTGLLLGGLGILLGIITANNFGFVKCNIFKVVKLFFYYIFIYYHNPIWKNRINQFLNWLANFFSNPMIGVAFIGATSVAFGLAPNYLFSHAMANSVPDITPIQGSAGPNTPLLVYSYLGAILLTGLALRIILAFIPDIAPSAVPMTA